MRKVSVRAMEKFEVNQYMGNSEAAIRSISPEPSGKFWAVSEVGTTDGTKCISFQKVIAWATVLETGHFENSFVSEVRPLVYEEEGCWLELSDGKIVELSEIPANAEIYRPDLLEGCPVELSACQFYVTWVPESKE